jgi:hypothetical protein
MYPSRLRKAQKKNEKSSLQRFSTSTEPRKSTSPLTSQFCYFLFISLFLSIKPHYLLYSITFLHFSFFQSSFRINETSNLRKALSCGEWDSEAKVVRLKAGKGKHIKSVGHRIEGHLCLHVEEALYLLETANIEIFRDGGQMSIQEMFSMIANGNFRLEHYLVYSYMKKLGYVIFRYEKKENVTKEEKKEEKTGEKGRSNGSRNPEAKKQKIEEKKSRGWWNPSENLPEKSDNVQIVTQTFTPKISSYSQLKGLKAWKDSKSYLKSTETQFDPPKSSHSTLEVFISYEVYDGANFSKKSTNILPLFRLIVVRYSFPILFRFFADFADSQIPSPPSPLSESSLKNLSRCL